MPTSPVLLAGVLAALLPLSPPSRPARGPRAPPAPPPPIPRGDPAMPTSRVILAALLAAFVTFAPGSGLAAVPKYPRLGLYGSVLGGGAPYVKADGSLDTLEIGRAARYSEVVLDVYPISPSTTSLY